MTCEPLTTRLYLHGRTVDYISDDQKAFGNKNAKIVVLVLAAVLTREIAIVPLLPPLPNLASPCSSIDGYLGELESENPI